MIRILAAALLAAAAMPAVALSPPPAPADERPAASTPAATEAGVEDRTCMRHTGTRVRHRAGRCPSTMGRSWSRDDLLSTGRSNVVDALRALDPSIR